MGIKNLVLVTAVTNVEHPGLSVFSNEERLKQLKDLTIPSIRKHIPNAYICLIEGSDLTSDELYKVGFDYVFYQDVNSLHKSVGELTLLDGFLSSASFQRLSQILEIQTVYKVSGRYFLNDNFAEAPDGMCLAKHNPKTWSGHGIYETRLYSFPYGLIKDFKFKIKQILADGVFIDIEHSFYKYNIFPDGRVHSPSKIGISGYLAPTGELIED
jgi:hypothetical protein